MRNQHELQQQRQRQQRQRQHGHEPPDLHGIGNPYGDGSAQARPVMAHRVSLPDKPGAVDMLTVMDADVANVYRTPDAIVLPEEQRSAAPHVRVYGARAQYVKLIQRMLALGLVELTKDPLAINGLFCVDKPDGTLRLILDARPANACFTTPPSPNLPTPSDIASLQANLHQPLFAAKVDLRNFYHQLSLPAWLRPYFAMPALSSRELGLADEQGDWFPMCTAVPMGWSHAVYVAQKIHQHVVLQRVGFTPERQIHANNANPSLVSWRFALYIDDLMMIGHDANEMAIAQDSYLATLIKLGLQPHMDKTVRPSSTGVELLGLELDGVRHLYGMSPVKLHKLAGETRALLFAGEATGRDVAAIVGAWVWASLVQRPALSLLSTVFRFARVADRRRFSLWSSVDDELEKMCRIAPLLQVRLASIFSTTVVASDASSLGQGVVAARMPVATIERIATWSGKYSLPCEHGDDIGALRGPASADIVPAIRASTWSTIVSARWRLLQHINALEAASTLTSLRWALSRPGSTSTKLLFLSDSSVVVAAFSKGRSSSPLLIPPLRRSAMLLLASNVRLSLVWVPTEVNPADAASRSCPRIGGQ